MIELMKEMPSPNVTVIKDLRKYLGTIYSHDYSDIEIRLLDNGAIIIDVPLPAGMDRFQLEQKLRRCFDSYHNSGAVYPVSFSGLKELDDNKVGSTRFCNMDPHLASWLTGLIQGRGVVDVIRDDDDDGSYYEMVNVSQYFRFMQYTAGGEHVPHYDSDFTYKYNNTVTKYSLVMYFTENSTGQLAFVKDTPSNTAVRMDWGRQALEEEITHKIQPKPLRVVLFPHTLCHSVLPFTPTPPARCVQQVRILARGDILFKKVGI